MATIRVKTRDTGWDALQKRLTQNPAHVVVGVQGTDDARPGESIGNVRLAGAHEFGVGVPERSFLRSTLAKNAKRYEALLEKLARAVVAGRVDEVQALALLGEKVVSDIRGRIEQNKLGVPLAPSTVARKGSSVPLIDTGALRNAITYTVRRSKAPGEGGS